MTIIQLQIMHHPIKNTYQMNLKREDDFYYYRDVDGQKVTFHVYKESEKHTVSYYARIASLGAYKAEATIIQGNRVKDSINMSEESFITIK